MKKTQLFCLTALLLGGLPAQAALIDRGGGLIYDDILDVTWLQDANYAQTSGYDSDGLMDWNTAMSWAAGLSYGGFDDWRLADIGPINGSTFDYTYSYDGSTDVGYNITDTDSELAYMFNVNLADVPYCNSSGSCNSANVGLSPTQNIGLFTHLVSDTYWSAAEFTPNTTRALIFSAALGLQLYIPKNSQGYAWAVRDGDVAAAASVPEPGSLSLLGLGGLLAWRRVRQHRVIG